MISTFREFLVDETGNATTEYALVATIFGLLIGGAMIAVSSEAAGQITFTDNGLNNRNGVSN